MSRLASTAHGPTRRDRWAAWWRDARAVRVAVGGTALVTAVLGLVAALVNVLEALLPKG